MSFMFEIGKTYITQEGKPVTVLARTGLLKGYECLQCSDGIFRYDRSTSSSDAGRATGTNHDYSDPKNFTRLDISSFDFAPYVSQNGLTLGQMCDAVKHLPDPWCE